MANPTWEYIAVDTSTLKPGTFYLILTDKDNATLTIEKPMNGNILFSTDLLGEHFELDGKIVKIKNYDNFLTPAKLSKDYFVVLQDGTIALKNATNVNVSVGCCKSEDGVIKEVFTGDKVIILGDANKESIQVQYSISNQSGRVVAGFFFVINDELLTSTPRLIHPASYSNSPIDELEFKVYKDANGIKLHIHPITSGGWSFKYKVSSI